MDALRTTFCALSFLALSCSQSRSPDEALHLKVEQYLDSVQARYPNYRTNTVIKDEMNDYLQKDFVNAVNNGVLEDLPFELDQVAKCNDKYIVSLEHSLTSKYYPKGLLDDLELDIYAETDEKTAKQLQEKKFYLIKGQFKDYITLENKEKFCAYVLMSPYKGFDSSIASREIQFGAIGISLKEIKPFIEK